MFRHDVSSHDAQVPDLIPQLSRGKHRNPRKGACFMELASYLAGERWSDHPTCTHPLLAGLARLVNDNTSDAGRGRLVELVPTVIGLTSDDPHVDVEIALRSATTALPVASAERQRVLAVSVFAAERVLGALDERPAHQLGERSQWALDQVPHAAEWARSFANELDATPHGFCKRGAPTVVRNAVVGIAQACVPDPDAILYDLLAGAIEDCAARCPGGQSSIAGDAGSARTPHQLTRRSVTQ
jgi:hypothetical protein